MTLDPVFQLLNQERWRLRARELLQSCTVEIDRSPVMAAPGSFLARLDHRERRICLNGYALDRETRPEESRRAWIAHELFHLLYRESDELRAAFPERAAEEAAADRFGELMENEEAWDRLA